MFKVELSTHAKHFLKRAPKEDRDRIVEKIKELAIDPFPSDVKRVLGRKEKVFPLNAFTYRGRHGCEIVMRERAKHYKRRKNG